MKRGFSKTKVLSIVLSILVILSVISFPTIKVKAAGTVDDFVERCYTVTLDRGSDPDGFADWKGQLTSGKAVGVHVAYGFLFSSEYTKKNKTNKDYVTDLYMLFMGREPDEAGFNDWVGQLEAGKSRTEVFAGFANSQEFYNICESYGITAGRWVNGYDRFQVNNVNLFVERLYKVCFGRIGDIGGQRTWVEKLLNKQITGSECARSFIQSQEYENLGLSDADYVENLYIALMGRASDAEGKENWINALASGKTRDEVFAGFVNSVEFAGICNTYKIDKGTYTAKDIGKIKKQDSPKKYRLVKEIEYDSDSISKSIEYEYDSNGNMIKQNTYDYYENENVWREYKYDSNNNMIKEIWYDIYGKESIWLTYEYDSNGRMIKNICYNSDGSISYCAVPEYDSNGYQIKNILYDADGNTTAFEESEYDADGNQIKGIWKNVDSSFYAKTEFKYDSNGNQIKKTVYNLDGSISFWDEYEYDVNGNKIKTTEYNSDGKSYWTCEHKYEEIN